MTNAATQARKPMARLATHWLVSGLLLLWGIAYAGLVIFTFGLSTPEHWAGLVSQGRISAAYADYISRIPLWVELVTILAALTRLQTGAVN